MLKLVELGDALVDLFNRLKLGLCLEVAALVHLGVEVGLSRIARRVNLLALADESLLRLRVAPYEELENQAQIVDKPSAEQSTHELRSR